MPSNQFCDHCEAAPPGCCHVAGHDRECIAGPRTDDAWKVGMVLWRDLTDRRGIKNELDQCEPRIQAQIIEKLGELAIGAVLAL